MTRVRIFGASVAGASGAGVSGYSGYSGYSGTGGTGISGYSGFSGQDGQGGVPGTSGYSGYSGYSGVSGYSGYSGHSGVSGYSGYSGVSGYSGYSGVGTSGYSGYSGLSGGCAELAPRGRIHLKANQQNLVNGVWTLVELDSISYNPDGICDVVNHKITPAVAGYYMVHGQVMFDYDDMIADVKYTAGLYMNGDTWVAISEVHSASGDYLSSVVSDVVVFDSDDYIELYARSKSGDTVDITAGIANTFLVLHRIGGGTSGYSGYSGMGTSGYSGYSGVSGYSGYSGISGYSGVSGYSGYSGYSGVGTSGYSGYSGIGTSGYSGYSGASGISGYSGYSGTSGISGYSGYSGASGISGYSGYSGASGISGYSGYSGASGISGYSGFSGYSGYSGISGYSGYSGISGYSGYSGISGYSGYSGFSGDNPGSSGYSGYSGFSGISGVAGGTILLPVEAAIVGDGTAFNAPADLSISTSSDITNPKLRLYVLKFDADADEHCYWQFVMPRDYTGDGRLSIYFYMDTDQADDTKTVCWLAGIQAVTPLDATDMTSLDIDGEGGGWVSFNYLLDYADPAVDDILCSGIIDLSSNLDNLAANDFVALGFKRDADSGSDDAVGDAVLVGARFEYNL